MNFEAVFRLLLGHFDKQKIHFALIGGFALHASGYMRTTQDIDFLVADEDVGKVTTILLSLGYEILHQSTDVTNFTGKLRELGRVDFLHARRSYTRKMLERAIEHVVLKGKFKVKTILPEDIIGLKVQASANDKNRYAQDMIDIETLMRLHRGQLNLELVREYFTLFNKQKELEDILIKVGYAR